MAKLALVCGVNEYDAGSFRKLDYGINDAVKVQVLLDLCGYETELIPGKRLTDVGLFDGVKSLASKASSGDTLLFFFSGHGCSFEEEQYVLPFNSRVENAAVINGVRLSDIVALTHKDGVDQIFVIDACRELYTSKGSNQNVMESLTRKGIEGITKNTSQVGIICACSDGAQSYESKKLKGGVFTSMLIDASIEIIQAGRQLNILNCTEAVDEKLKVLSRRIKEYFPSQSPWIQGGNLVINDGVSNPDFSFEFNDRHTDIESEYIFCESCGSSAHFLEIKNCVICERDLCGKHFTPTNKSFCNDCNSDSQRILTKTEVECNIAHLKMRKGIFSRCYKEIIPSGAVQFGQQYSVEEFIYEFSCLLLKATDEALFRVNKTDEIKRNMLINIYYGFSRVEFATELTRQRFYSYESHLLFWSRCESGLRKILFFGDARHE